MVNLDIIVCESKPKITTKMWLMIMAAAFWAGVILGEYIWMEYLRVF